MGCAERCPARGLHGAGPDQGVRRATGTYQCAVRPTAATIGIDAPRDAARGPDGRIWIADYAHHLVKAFTVTPNGVTWTNAPAIVLGDGVAGGGGDGQVNFPYNMDFSLDGQTVYVSDTGNNRVVGWDLTHADPHVARSGLRGNCPRVTEPVRRSACRLRHIDTLRRVVVDARRHGDHRGLLGQRDADVDGTTAPDAAADRARVGARTRLRAGVRRGDGLHRARVRVDRLNQRLEQFNATGGFIRAAGSRGTANGRFSWPEAVAVDPVTGVVWAADTRGDRIQRWAAWDHRRSARSPQRHAAATGVGQFNYIEDLDVAPDGDVYVADTRNDRIQVYDPPTDTFSVFPAAPTGGAMNDPQGVVATATSVFVADTGMNRILKFSRTTGAQQAVFSTGLVGPQGIAIDDADGRSGSPTRGTTGSCTCPRTCVNLGDTFGSAGSGNLQFNLPHTLDVTGDRLYVADTFNDRITYFDISSLGGGGPDTTPPTTTVTVPANAQVFTAVPVAMSGTATDNVGVQLVEVAIQDRVSKLWYRSNATWGAYQKQVATLGSPNAASTAWTYTWTPPAGGLNQYGVSVIATDTSSVVATGKPWRTFDVNVSGGGGGLTATYDSQISAAGGVAPLYPAGAAAATDGTRYVADSGGSRVVTISSGGVQTELSPASAGWNDPRDIDIDVEVPSELWVADTGDSQVIRLGTNGQVLATFGGTTVLNQPYGLANDASGVYVADTYNNRVVKLNESTGAVLWSVTTCGGNTLQRPRDVTVGSNGDIYVADTDRNRIVRLTAARGVRPPRSARPVPATVSTARLGRSRATAPVASGSRRARAPGSST